MKFPNVRYGNPEHLKHYAAGWPLKTLAKHLRRDERTIRRWLSGASKVTWWVPELLRLERYEKYHQMQQMNMNPALAKIGLVRGQVLEFPDIHDMRARAAQREQTSAAANIKKHNDRLLIRYK
ncbi:MAG: hypothetical protein V4488_05855 [Pseudomonadota bacterium]